MKIAIIGAGNVGGTLGARWARNGHSVTFGVRNPGDEKLKKLLNSAGSTARAATIGEAVKDASVVVLATPWEGAQSAIRAAGKLAGRILIAVIHTQPDAKLHSVGKGVIPEGSGGESQFVIGLANG